MLRDEQPLTDELRNAVISRLQKFLESTKKSADTAARSMGISAATLSQVLSGNYGADTEKHIRTIDRWTEQQIMREAAPKPPGYVLTNVAEQIYGVVRWGMKTGGIVVIHGPNGCGKTMTLQTIRAETPGCIYISINSSGRKVRSVLETLSQALRMGNVKLSGSQMFTQIVSVLKDTGRLIIVDECHKLAGRSNDDALHVLRDLHDATGCPMVWAGNGKIADYIQEGKTGGHDPLDQIFGRISVWLNLTELASDGGDDGNRLYTVSDIQKVFSASKLRITPDAARYLMLLANDSSFGCLRAAKNLALMAEMMAKDGPITADLLRTIQRHRLGRRGAELVDAQLEEAAKAVA
ncbi:MAG TPA: AAA family ATPase [Phycisphaerae bacterium]|nr:AAA family ATPase [Phycisphaerae bacterium]